MTEHDENEVTLPTEEEIGTLPRWAQVAFAARCARRVQPLFGQLWPDAPKKHIDAVDAAVTLAEGWASAARVTATAAHADATADAAHAAADAAYFAGGDAFGADDAAAADAADHAAADRASYAFDAARSAADAAYHAADAAYRAAAAHTAYFAADFAAKNAVRAAALGDLATDARVRGITCAAAANDYELLKTVAIREDWTNDTAVPPAFFGGLWPEGQPEGWPTSQSERDQLVNALRLQFSIPAEVDPDNADQLIQKIILAVNELYLAHGGSGLTIADNINVYEKVREPALAPAGGS